MDDESSSWGFLFILWKGKPDSPNSISLRKVYLNKQKIKTQNKIKKHINYGITAHVEATLSGGNSKMPITISINKIGIIFELKNNFLNIGFHARQYVLGTTTTAGISNDTKDGKRILFLDYDNILYEDMLLPELDYLQRKYGLSDFYIFKSSQKTNGFHAICTDKLNVREWQTILQESSCDEAYKNPRIKDFHRSVLRILPKGKSQAPTFIHKLKSPFQTRTKSQAHLKWLSIHHDINIEKVKNMDSYTNPNLVIYKTTNYL